METLQGLRKLRFVLILVAGLWLVGELAAIPVADRLIEQRVAERSRGIASVHATVGTFPVVARLVITGRVNSVTVTLDRVERLNLTFAQVRFDLEGAHIDRGALLRREARITAVERGTVTAIVDLGGLPPGVARLGRNVRVRSRTLLLGPTSFSLSFDILPCDPDARFANDQVILSCTIRDVPPALLDAAQGPSG